MHSQEVLWSTGTALSMQFPISSLRCRRPIYRRHIDRSDRPDAGSCQEQERCNPLLARACKNSAGVNARSSATNSALFQNPIFGGSEPSPTATPTRAARST